MSWGFCFGCGKCGGEEIGEGGEGGEAGWGGLGIVFANGDIELSLTVPITNSLAFLFTVLGEWWAEGKVISRGWCCFPLAMLAIEDVLGLILGRYLDWYGFCAWRYCFVRSVEEYLSLCKGTFCVLIFSFAGSPLGQTILLGYLWHCRISQRIVRPRTIRCI